jgi:hypothetical protein
MRNRSELLQKVASFNTVIIITLLFAGLMTGCVHLPAPYLPKDWIRTPTNMQSIADTPNQPRLQVIIVYAPLWADHTALRLVCPDRPIVFWDPGGSYGITDPRDVREKDIIVVDPPDLETYLRFTWHHATVAVEVFEWDLSREDARELCDVLLHGTEKTHPAGRFNTLTIGFCCSRAVSDFLHRFAKKTLTVPKSFFFPDDLERVLYTQSPKRVLIFRRGKEPLMYFSSRITSDDVGPSLTLN